MSRWAFSGFGSHRGEWWHLSVCMWDYDVQRESGGLLWRNVAITFCLCSSRLAFLVVHCFPCKCGGRMVVGGRWRPWYELAMAGRIDDLIDGFYMIDRALWFPVYVSACQSVTWWPTPFLLALFFTSRLASDNLMHVWMKSKIPHHAVTINKIVVLRVTSVSVCSRLL